MALLLYPTKGIVKKDGTPNCQILFDIVGEEGIDVFRNIFTNSNSYLTREFFNHELIKNLWPFFLKKLRYEHCFSNAAPLKSRAQTYSYISILLENNGLAAPSWWL